MVPTYEEEEKEKALSFDQQCGRDSRFSFLFRTTSKSIDSLGISFTRTTSYSPDEKSSDFSHSRLHEEPISPRFWTIHVLDELG